MIPLELDYHAHILPGCDHGSDGLETSLKQLAMAKAADVKVICATPHFYPHKETVASFLERRQASFERLVGAQGMPEILLGAEVLICEGIERLPYLNDLCLQGTNELLLEMPFYKWSEPLWDTVFALNDRRDIEVVIAHADRYPSEDIERLISEGLALQINANALSKVKHRKIHLSWIRAGFIKYLGSDIHMLGNGYTEYKKSRELIRKYC